MIAFIPCAGLGTRLKPLTDHCPKALVEYQGKPLLAHLLERLQREGYRRFVLNLHHFPDMLRQYADRYAAGHDVEICFSDETALLLDTGGALTHALPLFEGETEVLVHNVDVLSNLDTVSFRQLFNQTRADALLSVRRRETSRYLYAGPEGGLAAWKNLKTGEVKGRESLSCGTPLAFSGIHLLKTELIADWAGRYGLNRPFSVIDAYLAASRTHKILLEEQTDGYWKDMGKIADFHSPIR
ncbi:MAG: NTP transferase domain-containing protein [Bacteroidales bacterium]|nr:NTP transferase domain-containing protein [Bacteroidales bacterium]MDE7072509.1 NTP transferase domain-containing protein [Bacteroidales bacterium]